MRLGLALAAVLVTVPAAAQTPDPHAGMAGPMAGGGASMMESMNRMEQAMKDAPMTGDPDHDFVVMMIPHHQGAVDMARFELAHGKDPALRKLARGIIAAQEKEIGEMRRWLARHPG